MSIIENFVKSAIRDFPNFPRPGDQFKDITPIFLNPQLCRAVTEAFVNNARRLGVDAICGMESRGFLFGPTIAQRLDVPFVLIRKQGKLPGDTMAISYDMDSGPLTIEMRINDLEEGSRVLIHDDMLASGRTVEAVSKLVSRRKCKVAGYSFIAQLSYLKGVKKLKPFSRNIFSLAVY